MALIPSKAEKIVDAILSSNDKMLLVSIRGWSGNLIAVKSRDSFKERFFGVSRLIGTRYSGSLTIATLSLVNEAKDVFGEAQAIITLYKDCKVMLLPMPSHQILIGLAIERSSDTVKEEEREEGYDIASKIERLVADTL
ncbi:MAG TPA: hypothetical protein VKA87_09700 [Nitrososphaeraceae archaeon]|nr:hypothetical protein [Nitrososphaeraceae archaeon]